MVQVECAGGCGNVGEARGGAVTVPKGWTVVYAPGQEPGKSQGYPVCGERCRQKMHEEGWRLRAAEQKRVREENAKKHLSVPAMKFEPFTEEGARKAKAEMDAIAKKREEENRERAARLICTCYACRQYQRFGGTALAGPCLNKRATAECSGPNGEWEDPAKTHDRLAAEASLAAEKAARAPLEVKVPTVIGGDAGGPVLLLPPRDGPYREVAAIEVSYGEGCMANYTSAKCPGCKTVIRTASTSDTFHECDACKLRVMIPCEASASRSDVQGLKDAAAKVKAMPKPLPVLPADEEGLVKSPGGVLIPARAFFKFEGLPKTHRPGATVWHRVTGEGPWTLVQREGLNTSRQVPVLDDSRSGGTFRAEKTLIEDAWTVETKPGRFEAMPQAVLSLDEPMLVPPKRRRWLKRAVAAFLAVMLVRLAWLWLTR